MLAAFDKLLSDPVHQAPLFALSISAFTAVLLFASILIAFWQIFRAVHLQQRAVSSQLWDTYLGRALQYPEFAYPKNFPEKFDFDKATFGGSKVEFERYEWFVSTLLRAADEIIQEFGFRDHRAETAIQNVRYHRAYLRWRSRQKNQDDYLRLLSKKLVAAIGKMTRDD